MILMDILAWCVTLIIASIVISVTIGFLLVLGWTIYQILYAMKEGF